MNAMRREIWPPTSVECFDVRPRNPTDGHTATIIEQVLEVGPGLSRGRSARRQAATWTSGSIRCQRTSDLIIAITNDGAGSNAEGCKERRCAVRVESNRG